LSTVAVALVCKTPMPGRSKTRLSPPLRPEECAAISACFIEDVARTIGELADDGDVTGYAVYTPRGSEAGLRRLLPERFETIAQRAGGLGHRLIHAVADLFGSGHCGAILVNADSPTLPRSILRRAVEEVRRADCVVLGPALDGGYTLIGMSRPHARLFEDIPWSTSAVYRITLDRAREIGLSAVGVPAWYDVDDAVSLRMLEDEFAGRLPAFAAGAEAPATRRFLSRRIALADAAGAARSGGPA
jgi:rSAM/selenodomain-associated transferase 1